MEYIKGNVNGKILGQNSRTDKQYAYIDLNIFEYQKFAEAKQIRAKCIRQVMECLEKFSVGTDYMVNDRGVMQQVFVTPSIPLVFEIESAAVQYMLHTNLSFEELQPKIWEINGILFPTGIEAKFQSEISANKQYTEMTVAMEAQLEDKLMALPYGEITFYKK
ncbi:MAG: hypothetical protein UIC64_08910 [Agathobacter sp.]|nr:hypothetical protein [Agathobacter sp.]